MIDKHLVLNSSIVKDSCEQSGVNTIESLQGFHPLLIGEFWPPFIRAMLFQLSYADYRPFLVWYSEVLLYLCDQMLTERPLQSFREKDDDINLDVIFFHGFDRNHCRDVAGRNHSKLRKINCENVEFW